MHAVIERRLLIALSVICVVEAAVAVVPWLIDPSRMLANPEIRAQPNVRAAVSPLDETRPIESFGAFTSRPLFTASRRPPPESIASGGASGAPFQEGQVILGRYRLTGVVVTPKVRIAFVTDMNANKSIAVTEGEKLGDWVFTEITRDSITMQSKGRSNTVAFRNPTAHPGISR